MLLPAAQGPQVDDPLGEDEGEKIVGMRWTHNKVPVLIVPCTAVNLGYGHLRGII